MVEPGDEEALDELQKDIEKAQRKHHPQEVPEQRIDAMRISTELVVGTLVGAFIGYHLDGWFKTMPLFFIICLFLGLAGGARNIYKLAVSSMRDEKTSEKQPPQG